MMRKIFSALLVTLAGSLMVSQAIGAEDKNADQIPTYGDWGYRCEEGPDGKDKLCYVFQNVTKKDTGQLVLGARIAFRPEHKEPMLVVTVPLGSLLPPGAALTLEGAEPLKLNYFLCAADGCTTIATPIPDAMLASLKKGEQAVIRVATPTKQVVGLPLSLNGLTKALAVLKEKK